MEILVDTSHDDQHGVKYLDLMPILATRPTALMWHNLVPSTVSHAFVIDLLVWLMSRYPG
jgi:hypothetical protein